MDKAALSRATDPSAAPTPGYLYNDIAKTLSSPVACVETVTFLLSRLAKNNPHVKKKCLKVLAKGAVAPASRGMLKRAVAQNPAAVTAIKEALNWRGNPDPVHGDRYHEEVREAARECLEAVYSDAGEGGGAGGASGGMGGGGQLQGGGMQGLGGGGGYGRGGGGYGAPTHTATGIGSHVSGSPVSARTSAGGMQGIGSPMYADPRLQQGSGGTAAKLGSLASNVGGAVLDMIKDPLAKNVESQRGAGGGAMGGYDPNARRDPVSRKGSIF